MPIALATARPQGGAPPTAPGDDYEAGVCNIGPDEIAHRLTLAHVGLLISLGYLVLLLVTDAPLAARFTVALPAWGTAVAYLQAWRRFCVAFGALGVFNFGQVGSRERVADPQRRARDRRRALEIVVIGLFAGVVCGTTAVLLPI
ncbi:MAG TPA: hypothetical protein VM284_05125 [Candidatus Limnocylindria bacterium]|nr:hypothetical protein [Candidatus Limnocylindria bacterium]